MVQNGTWTAPGMCPCLNSSADRTSRIVGASPWSIRRMRSAGAMDTQPLFLGSRAAADGVERLLRADEDLPFGDRRRTERVLAEIVPSKELELRPGLRDRRHAVLVGDVDL